MRGRSLSEHSESYEIQLTLTYHRSNSGFRFSPCARATEEEPAATVVFAHWLKCEKEDDFNSEIPTLTTVVFGLCTRKWGIFVLHVFQFHYRL